MKNLFYVKLYNQPLAQTSVNKNHLSSDSLRNKFEWKEKKNDKTVSLDIDIAQVLRYPSSLNIAWFLKKYYALNIPWCIKWKKDTIWNSIENWTSEWC